MFPRCTNVLNLVILHITGLGFVLIWQGCVMAVLTAHIRMMRTSITFLAAPAMGGKYLEHSLCVGTYYLCTWYTGIINQNSPVVVSLGTRKLFHFIVRVNCVGYEWMDLLNGRISICGMNGIFYAYFCKKKFPWKNLARQLKLRVIPAGATWAFRTTPWRWTHGFTSSVAVWCLDHTKRTIFRVSGWMMNVSDNTRLSNTIHRSSITKYVLLDTQQILSAQCNNARLFTVVH